MSDRQLVMLPFLVCILYLTLPLPNPRELPFEADCFGCDRPAWLSSQMHLIVGFPMAFLQLIIPLRCFLVLYRGKLSNNSFFRTAVPILWLVFFVGSAYYLWHARRVIAYDFTSLIPYLAFAVVDFVFAVRLRRGSSNLPLLPQPRSRKSIPFLEYPR